MPSYEKSRELEQLKELFGDTYEKEDLVEVLNEVYGDLQLAIDRISQGNISVWGQVSSKGKVTQNSRKKNGPSLGGPGNNGHPNRNGTNFVFSTMCCLGHL